MRNKDFNLQIKDKTIENLKLLKIIKLKQYKYESN